ncbi:MAG: potassium channel protein [Planctomycetes bacterium]|nr:potassium channel protein [Planctomycetota bacterium]
MLLLLFILAFGTTGYWIISGNLLDAVYMTVITAATVGYGEVIDLSHNPAGRIFTIIFIILSLGVIAAVTSILAASILEIELSGFLRRRKMNKEVDRLSNHYIVCGAGETGIHIIQELAKTMKQFVVVERSQERLDKLAATVPNMIYLAGDATDDEVLLAAGVERAQGVFAVLPADKDNLYITVMTKQYNKNTRIVALGIEDKAINKLKTAGADTVVSASVIGGLRIASEMIRPSAVKFLDTMLRQTSGTYRIEEITITSAATIVNKRLADVPLRDRFGLLVLAIISEGDNMLYNPPADTVIKEGSIFVIMGDVHNIQKARGYISPG